MADDVLCEQIAEIVFNPPTKPCPRCGGKGYHHGFGEDGCDPDWCVMCGGCNIVEDKKARNRQIIDLIRQANGDTP